VSSETLKTLIISFLKNDFFKTPIFHLLCFHSVFGVLFYIAILSHHW